MNARELKRWAASAPPGTLVPVERIAELLDDVDDEAPVERITGASTHLGAEDWARVRTGGRVTGKTVARWCREGKIEGAYQLPSGIWMVPVDADPPKKKAPQKPEPIGRDGVLPLRELARRRSR